MMKKCVLSKLSGCVMMVVMLGLGIPALLQAADEVVEGNLGVEGNLDITGSAAVHGPVLDLGSTDTAPVGTPGGPGVQWIYMEPAATDGAADLAVKAFRQSAAFRWLQAGSGSDIVRMWLSEGGVLKIFDPAWDSGSPDAGVVTIDPTIGSGSITINGQKVLTENSSPASFPPLPYISNTATTLTIGAGNFATGARSFAGGSSSVASGENSFAYGNQAHASNYATLSVGQWTEATGPGGIALGARALAEGYYSTAIGVDPTASGAHSIALGHLTHAQALYSTALGHHTIAAGCNQTVIGQYNTPEGNPNAVISTDPALLIGNGTSDVARSNALRIAWNGDTEIAGTLTAQNLQIGVGSSASGTDSVALGYHNNSSSYASIAFGLGNNATHPQAIAMGMNSQSINNGAITIGYGNTASGSGAKVLGVLSQATGSGSIAIGYESHSSGIHSIAIGHQVTATGKWAIGMGENTQAQGYNQLTIGQYNTIEGDPFQRIDTDPALLIGNGTSDLNRSNALRIAWNGDTEIAGNTTINGNLTLNGGTLRIPPQGDIPMGNFTNGPTP